MIGIEVTLSFIIVRCEDAAPCSSLSNGENHKSLAVSVRQLFEEYLITTTCLSNSYVRRLIDIFTLYCTSMALQRNISSSSSSSGEIPDIVVALRILNTVT